MVHSVPERGLHDVVFMSSVQPALHTVRRTMATAAGRPARSSTIRAASVGDWLAHVRVVNTLLGGALPLIASWLLWPSPESRRLPDYLAAATDAEESFDRILAEQRRNTPSLEAAMTLLTYIRRFAVSTAALSVAGQLVTTSDSRTLEPFARVATGVLDDLAAALERRRPPAPFPVAGSVPMPPASTFPLLHARAARLARQLKSLHDAVEQWTAGEISSPS